MSREIWLGPILGDQRAGLIHRCAEFLRRGEPGRILYLAASYPLLEQVTTRLVEASGRRAIWGPLPVYLFRGFVHQLISTAVEADSRRPLRGRTPIDREEVPLAQSLLGQILKRRAAQGALPMLLPVAASNGCLSSVRRVLGEIQRAGKSPAEFLAIVESRPDLLPGVESGPEKEPFSTPRRQIDLDREIALIYADYQRAMNQFHLTEENADQLSAIAVLRGEIGGRTVRVPWLEEVRLLVLDGFFDFTPAQGDMLRMLIPRIPEVIVNVNGDARNPDIFAPFEHTLKQLNSMADFEVRSEKPIDEASGPLSVLKSRLFNARTRTAADHRQDQAPDAQESPSNITLLECADRPAEVRAIAKEIKRLVLTEGYDLHDIGLVVRERSSYADTILKIFREQSIPVRLDTRKPLQEIPAVQAALKLLRLLVEIQREGGRGLRAGDLADVLKTGYFRLDRQAISELEERLGGVAPRQTGERTPEAPPARNDPDAGGQRWITPRWDVDELENVVAQIGADLSLRDWLLRAGIVASGLAEESSGRNPESAVSEDLVADSVVEESSALGEDGEASSVSARRRGSRAAGYPDELSRSLCWSTLVLECLGRIFMDLPRKAPAGELRSALAHLLKKLQFARIVGRPLQRAYTESELTRVTLDLRGLEAMRRALAAVTRSFDIARAVVDPDQPEDEEPMAVYIEEVIRSLSSQDIRWDLPDPRGVAVLEATDIRGLRFKVIFVAGMVEGGFPLRISRDWIYPHEERKRLEQMGISLEDISPETLLKEEHYLYQVACRATERLCLSRPLVLEDDSATVASYFIPEIERAFFLQRIRRRRIPVNYDGDYWSEASTLSELATSLVRQEERRRQGEHTNLLPPDGVDRLMAWCRRRGALTDETLRRLGISRERAGGPFGPFDGLIGERRLKELLRDRYGPEHVYSASELNQYGDCAFRFFAGRVLRLEPRPEAVIDLEAADAGLLLHEILRRFLVAYRGRSLAEVDLHALQTEARSVADAVFDERERRLPPLNPSIWSIERETNKLLLDEVVAYEWNLQKQTRELGIVPAYFEWAFGMASESADPASIAEFLEIQPAGEGASGRVRLRGQIDRIDIARDGTAIAYDYKRSQGASIHDMERGRDLQIGIYLEAIEQLLRPGEPIAGGGYYTLREASGRRNRGIYRESLKAYTQIGMASAKPASSLTDEEWSQLRSGILGRVLKFSEQIQAGEFPVNPSLGVQSCKLCDFSAVCRFETFRIRQKNLPENPGAARS